MNDYGDMTRSSLHTRSNKCIFLSYPCQKLNAWWVVHTVNPRERLHILGDARYHDVIWEPAHQGNPDAAEMLVTISFYS
jgi:hypothetical protein